MPRQKVDVWRKLMFGNIRAKYKLCKGTTVGLVSRMTTHFDKCQLSKTLEAGSSSTDEGTATEKSTSAKVPRQCTLPFKSSARETQHEINLQITRYINTLINSNLYN